MSWIAAGTAAAGLAGSIMGGGGSGGAAPAMPNNFGPANITFGSVNFKSAGAGDKGKTTGAAEAATEAALASGRYNETPGWLWPVVALAGIVVVALVFLTTSKK